MGTQPMLQHVQDTRWGSPHARIRCSQCACPSFCLLQRLQRGIGGPRPNVNHYFIHCSRKTLAAAAAVAAVTVCFRKPFVETREGVYKYVELAFNCALVMRVCCFFRVVCHGSREIPLQNGRDVMIEANALKAFHFSTCTFKTLQESQSSPRATEVRLIHISGVHTFLRDSS